MPQRLRRHRGVLGVLGCVALVAGLVGCTSHDDPFASAQAVIRVGALPTAAPTHLGETFDPLSDAEYGYVRSLASSASGVPGTARDVTGGQGPEVITIDPDLSATEGRHATALLYDYAADVLYTVHVDLRTGSARVETSEGSQPPPNARETRRATEILLASPVGQPWRDAYAAGTGEELTSADQLEVLGGAHVPPAPGGADDACSTHRCARLQITTDDGLRLTATNPVVDLSAGAAIEQD
ncbi:hypothetical protein [Xylanimonas ulmi]|uniref:hypothetical protein n=1 Tax=Xylanimonas ulmi TaxID=228973 RepID=UPI00102BC681|nr:hypothetical protein [Xylanibacterium ulmi]